nr:RecName: Full=Pregnancy-associated glycoprotein 61b; AltName: Full=ovPAG 61b [Ovis aries]
RGSNLTIHPLRNTNDIDY